MEKALHSSRLQRGKTRPPGAGGAALALLFLLLASFASGASAQSLSGTKSNESGKIPGTIEGWVATPEGHAVPGARVRLLDRRNESAEKTDADAEGRFRFSALPAGSYRVRVEAEGFDTLERGVELASGETARLNVTIHLAPLTASVTVTATRTQQALNDVPIQVSVLPGEDLRTSPALTVDGALKQVPSFSLFRRTSSLVSHPTTQGVSLRGIGTGGTSRTLVLLDGVPHNDAFGNWVYWSKIPRTEIESVEVAEGGLSNLYGSSAMGGVINIRTRKPERRTFLLEGQGGMLGTGSLDFFGSRRAGPWGVSVGGSAFRTGGYRLLRAEEGGTVDRKAASRHETLNWRLNYTPPSGITFFQNGRSFDESRDNGTPLRENSTREVYLGGGVRSASRPAASSSESDWQVTVFSHIQTFKSSFSRVAPDRMLETLALLQDVPSRDLGVSAHWSRRMGDMHQLTLGSDLRRITADNIEDVFLADGFNIRDRFITGKQLLAGFFLQDRVTPTARLALLLGARIDTWRNFNAWRDETLNTTGEMTRVNFPDTSETTVTPQAGIVFHATEDFTLRGAFYQGFRAPTLNELYRPFRVGNVATNANENLGPERLTGGEAGFNYVLRRRVFWRVTGYWNRLRDSISNVTLSSTPTLITRQRQNLGRSRIRGLGTEVDYRISRQWRVHTRYLFNEAMIEEFAPRPEIEGNFLPQVPKHRGTLRIAYRRLGWGRATLQGRYESLRFDDDLNQLRLGSFFTADVSLSRPLGESWEAFLSVENLFDRRYAVQATPLGLLGTPRLAHAGIRFQIFPG